ncbi:MAG TPA: glycosyltransferase family 39 protein [Vicinamibacterales bacterium]|nr:glycosyltransferase family 39 protein [Vicinamibacterales bacterium]
MSELPRRRALLWLCVVTAIGGALRFYQLDWGAPYYHFHIDEHFVFTGADNLRVSMEQAANAPKFFMYSPLPMYLLNGLRAIYEVLGHRLDLTNPQDEITYMVLGRAISAAFATATIPLVYAIAARVAGRSAGVLSAAFLAVTVLSLRDAHFFTVDATLVFFCCLTWLAALRVAERGDLASIVGAGVAFGLAVLSKYSAAFLGAPLALAYLVAPGRPTTLAVAPWLRWGARGALILIVAAVVFLIVDPMVWLYYARFRQDVREQITEPLLGLSKPQWLGSFADLQHPRAYWFMNLLWWGLGPALEVWALAGLVWLCLRRTRLAWVSVAVPVAYFATAGNSVAPFIRYALPLMPAMAVAGGILSADLLRRPRTRAAAVIATTIVLASTSLYAAAYMNIFRKPDSRVAAADYMRAHIPAGAAVLVEPTHNLPPTGAYRDQTDFYRDYMPWDPFTDELREFRLIGMDSYRYLYSRELSDADKQRYINSRLALADWIVIDDYYLQTYRHLPATEHGVMKQFYRDLFNGQLPFRLEQSFKTYPSLFGVEINDDRAEMTFRHFDHPRIFVFRRTGAAGR